MDLLIFVNELLKQIAGRGRVKNGSGLQWKPHGSLFAHTREMKTFFVHVYERNGSRAVPTLANPDFGSPPPIAGRRTLTNTVRPERRE